MSDKVGCGRMNGRRARMGNLTRWVAIGAAAAGSVGTLAVSAGPVSAESLQACEVLYQLGGVSNQGTSASFLADVLRPLGQTVSAVSAPVAVANCAPPQAR